MPLDQSQRADQQGRGTPKRTRIDLGNGGGRTRMGRLSKSDGVDAGNRQKPQRLADHAILLFVSEAKAVNEAKAKEPLVSYLLHPVSV